MLCAEVRQEPDLSIDTCEKNKKLQEFRRPQLSNGKARTRTRSCESNVKLQNVTMLDYMKKFADAEKNFSLEKLKKSVSNYDKFNKFNVKEVKKFVFDRVNGEMDILERQNEIVALPPTVAANGVIDKKIEEKDVEISTKGLIFHEDKNAVEVMKRKHGVQFNPSFNRAPRNVGSYWEFVVVFSHDKRLQWFTQTMNWIKMSGEILLYENNFKVLTRKFVVCNFSIETPLVPSDVPQTSKRNYHWSKEISKESTREQCDTSQQEGSINHFACRPLWIDTSYSYNFRASEDNLENFNLILFIIPTPVVLDSHKEDFNNGWKLITIIVPSLHLGVQNISCYTHEVPFPDKSYNRNGGYHPWWSYHFQVVWESNARKRSHAAWNAVLEFENPFGLNVDGLNAKILISSSVFHVNNNSVPHFVPRPSLCYQESFANRSSPTIVRDIFLPRSLRYDGTSIIQVPSFAHFIALPRVVI